MKLVSKINIVIGAVNKSVVEVLAETAETIRDDAKRNAPVRTGRLRDSIQAKIVDEKTAVVGTDVNYAIFQEYGTSRGVPATYFLTNAFHSNEQTFAKKLKQKVKNGSR